MVSFVKNAENQFPITHGSIRNVRAIEIKRPFTTVNRATNLYGYKR